MGSELKSSDKDKSNQEETPASPSISQLEADVAYFDARLSMLGTPSTSYQQAQLKAYQVLEGMLVQSLVRVRGRLLSMQTTGPGNDSNGRPSAEDE